MERQYKYLGILTIIYITFQLVSDVTAGKIIDLLGYPVSVTVLYFPITLIIADVLTEVYGYSQSRNVLWKVLIASILAGLLYQLVVSLPPAIGFDANDAYIRVLGIVPRILLGGWIAVFVGSILNDFILAKMKVWTKGKHLWMRTIGSTIIGEFANTALFYVIALYGILPSELLIASILTGWVLKVAIEVAMTPLTYAVIAKLKRAENEDYYDTKTNFNPFKLE